MYILIQILVHPNTDTCTAHFRRHAPPDHDNFFASALLKENLVLKTNIVLVLTVAVTDVWDSVEPHTGEIELSTSRNSNQERKSMFQKTTNKHCTAVLFFAGRNRETGIL
jgi:hypothetical protein